MLNVSKEGPLGMHNIEKGARKVPKTFQMPLIYKTLGWHQGFNALSKGQVTAV
jgi:hypothetical protein